MLFYKFKTYKIYILALSGFNNYNIHTHINTFIIYYDLHKCELPIYVNHLYLQFQYIKHNNLYVVFIAPYLSLYTITIKKKHSLDYYNKKLPYIL